MNKHLETLCNVVLPWNFTRVTERRDETNISVNQFSFTTRRSTIKDSRVHKARQCGVSKKNLLHSKRSTIDLIYLIRWNSMRKEENCASWENLWCSVVDFWKIKEYLIMTLSWFISVIAVQNVKQFSYECRFKSKVSSKSLYFLPISKCTHQLYSRHLLCMFDFNNNCAN